MATTATNSNGKVPTSVKRDVSRKPPPMPVIPDGIPIALRELPRWLGWNWELDKRSKKWTKPPINVQLAAVAYSKRARGSSTDPSTWVTFEEAIRVAEMGAVDGIGFALGDGFCGIDFDNCRNRDTGEISPDVMAYIRRLNTYGEVSPSGEGVKLLLRGTLPKGQRSNGNVEMYDSGRYFTVTGHRLDGCPCALAENNQELAAIHDELIQAPCAVDALRRNARMSDRELAIAALGGLSPKRADTYRDWLLVGMALHAVDVGLLECWDGWSQQSTKYSAGCCADKWKSFKRTTVGLGSLIYWAQQDTGWKFP